MNDYMTVLYYVVLSLSYDFTHDLSTCVFVYALHVLFMLWSLRACLHSLIANAPLVDKFDTLFLESASFASSGSSQGGGKPMVVALVAKVPMIAVSSAVVFAFMAVMVVVVFIVAVIAVGAVSHSSGNSHSCSRSHNRT